MLANDPGQIAYPLSLPVKGGLLLLIMTEMPFLCAHSVFSMASAVPCILRTALGMAAVDSLFK